MANINKEVLKRMLDAKLSGISASSEIDDFLITKVLENFDADLEFFVDAPANLPDLMLKDLANGTIVYVQSLNIHLISNQGKWLGLDGRVYRDDNNLNTVWAWGFGSGGKLGDNSSSSRTSPVSVVGGFTDWCQVSAGNIHSMAVRQNGTLWGWGFGTKGVLGNGSSTNQSSPVSVVGGFTDWCQVSAGSIHSIALRTNGTLWSWGCNDQGVLGNFVSYYSPSPVSVVGGFTDWCQVSAGWYSSAAVRQNGTLWAWGNGSCGGLGDNTTLNRSSPVSVVGGFTDWCQVSVGDGFMLGLRQTGTVWGWGNNYYGHLGDNTCITRSSPVSVVGGFTDWCQVSAGRCHSAGIRSNGTIWSWGSNNNGRLGDGTTTRRSSPVSVIGGFTDWCFLDSGGASGRAIRTNGTMWSWGNNFGGVLGDNTTVSKTSPVSVVGGFTDWCQLSTDYHTLAIRSTQQ